MAAEGRAGPPAPPWEVRRPFVPVGPPLSLGERLGSRQSPDSLVLLPGGCHTDTSSAALFQLPGGCMSCALPYPNAIISLDREFFTEYRVGLGFGAL